MPGSPIFGPGLAPIATEPGSRFITSPDNPWSKRNIKRDDDDEVDPLLEWCRNAAAVLKQEKHIATEEMTRALNVYRGGVPWWRHRPKWKIGSHQNFCATIPIQWASILSDNKPQVTYASYRTEDQRIADIATAAFAQAYQDGGWQSVIRNTILDSRIVKKGFLRLTYDPYCNGGMGAAVLTLASGTQIYCDNNAPRIRDAEVILYEYQESPNKIFARWPHLKEKIVRKRHDNRGYEYSDNGSQLAPAATMEMPTGTTVNNPPYAANANPPDGAGGTSGILVQEFWTRPRKTIKVSEVLFTAGGEPATERKTVTLTDGTEETVRRVITEGGIICEWPQGYIDIVREVEPAGGLRILDEMDCYDVVCHKVDYPLYPDGRQVVIVDQEFKAEDQMNPLGYMPFVEIAAYPDPEKMWGLSDIDLIMPQYEKYVRLDSMMFDAANLTSNPIWRLPIGTEMSDEDITNAPGAIQREDAISLKLGKREPGPDMPSYVMKYLEYTKAQIYEISGINEISSGTAKFKGQQSAETVSMYQEAAGVRFNDALHRIEEAMVELGEQFLELMTRFYTTPRLVQIKGDAQVPEPIPFIGSQFVAPLKIEAKPGSSRTPTSKFNILLNLLNSGKTIVDMPEVWEQLGEMGVIKSPNAMERRITKNLGNPATAWLVTGVVPGAQGNNQTPKKSGGGSKKKGPQSL